MFGWLKQRIYEWVERQQQREIERLHRKAMCRKEELERQTGEPVQLPLDARRRLAEKAKGIDPETLKRISVFDPEELQISESDSESTENR